MRQHKTATGTLDRLAELPGVGSLPRQTRERIDSRSAEIRIASGDGFIRQGCPGRQSFIITEGQAEVRRDGQLVAVVSAGDLVGETAVLRRTPRNADLVAKTDVKLLAMSPAELMTMCADPDFEAWAQRTLKEHAVPA